MPLLICGTGTTGTTYKNYGTHTDDYKKYDPFGGGISTLKFSLKFLYDEYCKHRNTWSRSNQELELVRYRGCSFKLYRHSTCDFFVNYDRKGPFTDSQLTGPKLHPANMLMSRKRVIVKSYKTYPKGRATKVFRVRPPTLLTDKWYFQKDMCNTTLLTVGASIGNLRFPFCSPQTDNCCIYFQVFTSMHQNAMSISADYLETNYNRIINYLKSHWHEDMRKGTITNYKEPDRMGTVFNTFKTEEHIKEPPIKPQTSATDQTSGYNKYYTGGPYSYDKVNSLWGDYIYTNGIIDAFQQNATKYYESRRGGHPSFLSSKYLNHKTGIFSPIFLARQRLSPDFPGFYQEVIYNPNTDKGIGNKVWIVPCTQQDNMWNPNSKSSYPIVDIPLWMCFLGYSDYVAKASKSPGHWKEVRLVIISPYTQPPLYNPNSRDQGYVPFDSNFGEGKMPDGQPYIPIEYRFSWYICMFHQQNIMNDFAQSGPFAYDGSEKSAVLSARYKFTFYFGGNPIPQQTIKDPCTQPTYPFPDPSGQPATVQVEDPSKLDERFYFKRWDIRRGIFGQKAIKRMSAEQVYDEFLTGEPKRPRLEVPPVADEDYNSEETRSTVSSKSPRTTTKRYQEKEKETTTPQLKQQLLVNIQEQKRIKSQLKELCQQLVKTQCHLNAPIYP